MKLVEALKNLAIIAKRIDGNTEKINQYATHFTANEFPFQTADAQRVEVDKLIQSNIDLQTEYLKLKRCIAKTNLETMVTIDTFTYSIADLLALKAGAYKFYTQTYAALNPDRSLREMRQTNFNAENPPKVIRMYDERLRNEKLEKYTTMIDAITGKLEVVNAETDLIGY